MANSIIDSWVPGGFGGNGSYVTNGQIIAAPMGGQFFPTTAAYPAYKGNGQPPPTIPINYMSGGGYSGSTLSATAAANPLNFQLSPVIMALLALIIGLAGLRWIHWR